MKKTPAEKLDKANRKLDKANRRLSRATDTLLMALEVQPSDPNFLELFRMQQERVRTTLASMGVPYEATAVTDNADVIADRSGMPAPSKSDVDAAVISIDGLQPRNS